MAPGQMREDVLFGAGVFGVVTDHEQIDGRVQRQPAGPPAVMDAGADGEDLALLFELHQGVDDPLASLQASATRYNTRRMN